MRLRYLHGYDPDYVQQELKPWLDEDEQRAAIILEENPAALFQWQEDHPRIHLRMVPHAKAWSAVIEACVTEFPYPHVEVISKKPSLRLKILRRAAVWHSKFSEAIASGQFYRNILLNFPRLSQSFVVNRWKGAFEKIPAIICGAGPSLEQAASALKTLSSKALIIAGGSTLSALSHFNIRPHLGLAMDPNGREFDAISGCKYRDIPLLYCNRLLPRVFDHFTGPYGYIRSMTGGTIETYLEEKIGLQDEIIGPELGSEAMSVTTMATALAYAFGCDPIIFVGVDLAFSQKKRYVAGVATPSPEESVSEQPIFRKGKETLIKWVMESESISKFAKDRPERRWIDASDGLGFKAIARTPLHEISFPRTYKNLIPKMPPSGISHSQILALYEELRQNLEKCRDLCKKIQESEGARALVFEMDLAEEPAYKALLEVAAFAYERIAGPTNKYPFLLECIESHLQTLKLIP